MDLQEKTALFLSVVESHKRIIFKVANLYCRNKIDREDLVQEIIFQLWKSFANYNSAFKYSTWIYRIALNVSISSYRKESRRTQINRSLNDNVFHLQHDDPPNDKQEQLDRLVAMIRDLREIDRAIIILYLEENSAQEIAGILDLSVTNVNTKVSRIKQQLKNKFLNDRNQ